MDLHGFLTASQLNITSRGRTSLRLLCKAKVITGQTPDCVGYMQTTIPGRMTRQAINDCSECTMLQPNSRHRM
jgi:hypothetical protein